MARYLKIYQTPAQTVAALPGVKVMQKYPAFTLVEAADDAAAAAVSAAGLTEDVTACYDLHAGDKALDTSVPHIAADGAALTHPAYADQPPLPRGPHHFIVQFIGPIRRPWLAEVKKAGAEVVSPYTGYSVIIRATAKVAGAVSQLKCVRWVGHLPYASRLSPHTARDPSAPVDKGAPQTPRTRLLHGAYSIQFFNPERAAEARAAVGRLGFLITEDLSKRGLLEVTTKRDDPDAVAAQLQALARVHGVQQVTRKAINRISNDRAGVVMGVGAALATPVMGLSGHGEIIGICDTGLDSGDPATIHPDFTGRIKAIKSYPIAPAFAAQVLNPGADDGAEDVDSGHGTHTSGSIVGDGTASSNLPGLAGPVRGLAYQAQLVFQAVEQFVQWKPQFASPSAPRYILAGLPSDLTDLLTWSYGQGARIHSNSWGGGDPQIYNPYCTQIDTFIWNKPDFCVLFAAGNDGQDNDGDGVIDEGSVSPPGTAKNCITVGATANNRPDITQTNEDLWGAGAAPTAALAAGDPANLAPFSSRGPTQDQRIKPDVVAPGTYVLSTRSRRLAEKTWGYGRYGSSSLYMYDCGTSMATPLTAGAVGVIREYLRTKKAIASPSAALLKAAVIAGAVPVNGRGGPPDNHQGFGRVNVDAVVAPAAPLSATFAEGPKLATGDLNARTVQIATGGHPLTVVLVYSDYPGPNLVNNLNLIVRGPAGQAFTGNGAATGPATFDSANNVERVLVPAADAGAWTIQVVGSNIPNGPQPFALVVIGAT